MAGLLPMKRSFHLNNVLLGDEVTQSDSSSTSQEKTAVQKKKKKGPFTRWQREPKGLAGDLHRGPGQSRVLTAS